MTGYEGKIPKFLSMHRPHLHTEQPIVPPKERERPHRKSSIGPGESGATPTRSSEKNRILQRLSDGGCAPVQHLLSDDEPAEQPWLSLSSNIAFVCPTKGRLVNFMLKSYLMDAVKEVEPKVFVSSSLRKIFAKEAFSCKAWDITVFIVHDVSERSRELPPAINMGIVKWVLIAGDDTIYGQGGGLGFDSVVPAPVRKGVLLSAVSKVLSQCCEGTASTPMSSKDHRSSKESSNLLQPGIIKNLFRRLTTIRDSRRTVLGQSSDDSTSPHPLLDPTTVFRHNTYLPNQISALQTGAMTPIESDGSPDYSSPPSPASPIEKMQPRCMRSKGSAPNLSFLVPSQPPVLHPFVMGNGGCDHYSLVTDPFPDSRCQPNHIPQTLLLPGSSSHTTSPVLSTTRPCNLAGMRRSRSTDSLIPAPQYRCHNGMPPTSTHHTKLKQSTTYVPDLSLLLRQSAARRMTNAALCGPPSDTLLGSGLHSSDLSQSAGPSRSISPRSAQHTAILRKSRSYNSLLSMNGYGASVDKASTEINRDRDTMRLPPSRSSPRGSRCSSSSDFLPESRFRPSHIPRSVDLLLSPSPTPTYPVPQVINLSGSLPSSTLAPSFSSRSLTRSNSGLRRSRSQDSSSPMRPHLPFYDMPRRDMHQSNNILQQPPSRRTTSGLRYSSSSDLFPRSCSRPSHVPQLVDLSASSCHTVPYHVPQVMELVESSSPSVMSCSVHARSPRNNLRLRRSRSHDSSSAMQWQVPGKGTSPAEPYKSRDIVPQPPAQRPASEVLSSYSSDLFTESHFRSSHIPQSADPSGVSTDAIPTKELRSRDIMQNPSLRRTTSGGYSPARDQSPESRFHHLRIPQAVNLSVPYPLPKPSHIPQVMDLSASSSPALCPIIPQVINLSDSASPTISSPRKPPHIPEVVNLSLLSSPTSPSLNLQDANLSAPTIPSIPPHMSQNDHLSNSSYPTKPLHIPSVLNLLVSPASASPPPQIPKAASLFTSHCATKTPPSWSTRHHAGLRRSKSQNSVLPIQWHPRCSPYTDPCKAQAQQPKMVGRTGSDPNLACSTKSRSASPLVVCHNNRFLPLNAPPVLSLSAPPSQIPSSRSSPLRRVTVQNISLEQNCPPSSPSNSCQARIPSSRHITMSGIQPRSVSPSTCLRLNLQRPSPSPIEDVRITPPSVLNLAAADPNNTLHEVITNRRIAALQSSPSIRQRRRCSDNPAPPAAFPGRATAPSEGPGVLPAAPTFVILIVETAGSSKATDCKALETPGLSVIVANEKEGALVKWRATKFDVVFITLGEGAEQANYLSVAETIRTEEKTAKRPVTPLVALVNNLSSQTTGYLFNDVLLQPLTRDGVLTTVRKWAGKLQINLLADSSAPISRRASDATMRRALLARRKTGMMEKEFTRIMGSNSTHSMNASEVELAQRLQLFSEGRRTSLTTGNQMDSSSTDQAKGAAVPGQSKLGNNQSGSIGKTATASSANVGSLAGTDYMNMLLMTAGPEHFANSLSKLSILQSSEPSRRTSSCSSSNPMSRRGTYDGVLRGVLPEPVMYVPVQKAVKGPVEPNCYSPRICPGSRRTTRAMASMIPIGEDTSILPDETGSLQASMQPAEKSAGSLLTSFSQEASKSEGSAAGQEKRNRTLASTRSLLASWPVEGPQTLDNKSGVSTPIQAPVVKAKVKIFSVIAGPLQKLSVGSVPPVAGAVLAFGCQVALTAAHSCTDLLGARLWLTWFMTVNFMSIVCRFRGFCIGLVLESLVYFAAVLYPRIACEVKEGVQVAILVYATVAAMLMWLLASYLRNRLCSGETHKTLARMAAATKLKAPVREDSGDQSATTEFLSILNHEVRTPLAAILGMTDLLLDSDPKLSPMQREILTTIQQCSQQLSSNIDEILDLAKAEEDRVVLRSEEMNVRTQVEDAIYSLCHIAFSKGSDIFLDTQMPYEWFLGDALRIRQIVTSLLSSALKHTRAGTILVRVYVSDTEDEVATLRVTCTDIGRVINDEQLQTIWAATQESEGQPLSPRRKGAAMELAAAQSVCRMMGGDCGVSRVTLEGCNYWCKLTLKKVCQASMRDARASRPSHVLVLRPILSSGLIVKRYLEGWGHTCVVKTSLADTIKLLSKQLALQRSTPQAGATRTPSFSGIDGLFGSPDMTARTPHAPVEHCDCGCSLGPMCQVAVMESKLVEENETEANELINLLVQMRVQLVLLTRPRRHCLPLTWERVNALLCRKPIKYWTLFEQIEQATRDASAETVFAHHNNGCGMLKVSRSRKFAVDKLADGEGTKDPPSNPSADSAEGSMISDIPASTEPSAEDSRPLEEVAKTAEIGNMPMAVKQPAVASTVLPVSPRGQPEGTTEAVMEIVTGIQILLVEDHVVNQKIARNVLEKDKHLCQIAENGLIAVNVMEQPNGFALILMDCQMPVMDGFTATTRIREVEARESRTRIPIIALTALNSPGDRDRCIAAGMDDYLTKPIKRDQLQKTIYKWMVQKGKQPSSSSSPPSAGGPGQQSAKTEAEAQTPIPVPDSATKDDNPTGSVANGSLPPGDVATGTALPAPLAEAKASGTAQNPSLPTNVETGGAGGLPIVT